MDGLKSDKNKYLLAEKTYFMFLNFYLALKK